MKVLILSKTHVGSSACVGGVVIKTNEFVRLLNGPGQFQAGNTQLNIGQVWDIDYESHPDKEPHNEDVHIKSKKYLYDIENLQIYIQEKLPIWKGKPEDLFDGKMNYLDASIRGIKFQKKQIPNSKKRKNDASIGELYPKRLKWTANGSGYLNNPEILPLNSVGFWISDRDIVLEDNRYYIFPTQKISINFLS